MRRYEPTDEDRKVVLRLAAIPGVTREDIAACVRNPRTNKPINRRVLEKCYGEELKTAMHVMRQITMKSFVEQIEGHVWPATRMALSNYCRLKDDGDAAVKLEVENRTIIVQGVKPQPRPDDQYQQRDINSRQNPAPCRRQQPRSVTAGPLSIRGTKIASRRYIESSPSRRPLKGPKPRARGKKPFRNVLGLSSGLAVLAE